MTDDAARPKIVLVTRENADGLVREKSFAAMRATEAERHEQLCADNPFTMDGEEVGEFAAINACVNRHVNVRGDRTSRLLTCIDCGANVDPMAWIFHAAEPVKRLLNSESFLRREMAGLERTRNEMKNELAKLRADIRKEVERAERLGLATAGTKNWKHGRRSADRVVSHADASEAVTFVVNNGGTVIVKNEDGEAIAYVVHPSLRFSPK